MMRTGGYYAQVNKNNITYELKTNQEYFNGTAGHLARVHSDNPTPANLGMVCLNTMALGTDYNLRIGRKILIKSILIRGVTWFQPSALPYQSTSVRIMLVLDKQANGSDPTIDQILELYSVGAGTRLELVTTAPLNLNYRDRFVILTDKVFTMTLATLKTTAGTSDNSQLVKKTWKIYKKNLSIDTTYSGTTGAISDLTTNALHLIFINPDPIANSTVFTHYTQRLRFYDC